MEQVNFKALNEVDISELEAALPAFPGFYNNKLADQNAGHVTTLIAWVNGRPVARGSFQAAGSSRSFVRERLSGIPNIDSVEVADTWRNCGIGKQLMIALENLARLSDFSKVGLAVEVNNHDAVRFYQRLGYRPWLHGEYDGSWSYRDMDDVEHEVAERYVYYTKELTA